MTEYEAFAIELAREAARVTLPFFRSDIGHEDKGGAAGFDPVTEADRGAEAVMRRMIKASFPQHGIVGSREHQPFCGAIVADALADVSGAARRRDGGQCRGSQE